MSTCLPGKILNADEYALRHDQDLGFEAAIIRARQNCNLRLLASDRAKAVLEVGCGPNLLVQRAVAASIPFENWTIVEPAATYYEAAIAHARAESRLNVVNGYLEHSLDALRIMAPHGFDAVLLSGVLHETTEPEALLRCAVKTMRLGSRIHISVPNALSFHRLLAVKMDLIDDPTALSERNRRLGHSIVFTPTSLRELVERVGLVDLRSEGYLFKPFTNEQLLLMTRMFGDAIARGMEELGRDFPENGAEICVTASKVSHVSLGTASPDCATVLEM